MRRLTAAVALLTATLSLGACSDRPGNAQTPLGPAGRACRRGHRRAAGRAGPGEHRRQRAGVHHRRRQGADRGPDPAGALLGRAGRQARRAAVHDRSPTARGGGAAGRGQRGQGPRPGPSGGGGPRAAPGGGGAGAREPRARRRPDGQRARPGGAVPRARRPGADRARAVRPGAHQLLVARGDRPGGPGGHRQRPGRRARGGGDHRQCARRRQGQRGDGRRGPPAARVHGDPGADGRPHRQPPRAGGQRGEDRRGRAAGGHRPGPPHLRLVLRARAAPRRRSMPIEPAAASGSRR